MDGDPVDVLAALGVVIGPVEVVEGTSGDHGDLMAPCREPGGKGTAERFATADDLASVALDDVGDAHQRAPIRVLERRPGRSAARGLDTTPWRASRAPNH